MTPYYQDDHVTIYHGDAFDVLPSLASQSVGMVFADPPYFRVKGDWWDRQWDTSEGFLAWLGGIADEWRRLLTNNGSMYCFASSRMAARVEIELSQRFRILNSLVWVKPDPSIDINYGPSNGGRLSKDAMRSFYPSTERLVFAEHFGQDTTARGDWSAADAELRESVFRPLQEWMAEELARTGWSKHDLNEAMGFAPQGMASSRYFGRSQWQLPTSEHYERIQQLTGGFRRGYEDLRAEYEHLRRPFNSHPDHPYTDVWTFPTVNDYPTKHPCEKPQALIRHAINISHRADLPPILDCFAGTGSTLRAAKDLGRQAIGIEIEERYCEIAARRMGQEVLPI